MGDREIWEDHNIVVHSGDKAAETVMQLDMFEAALLVNLARATQDEASENGAVLHVTLIGNSVFRIIANPGNDQTVIKMPLTRSEAELLGRISALSVQAL